MDRGLRIRTMALPDRFIDHDTPKAMYEAAGLTASHIVATALRALGIETLPATVRATPVRAAGA